MKSDVNPILIVEDRAVDVDLTRRALLRRKLVNPIEIARDGEEALAFLSRWEAGERVPAFILLDLKLPKVSGLEFLRQVKQHPKFHSIPVIVLTSSAEFKDKQAAYELHCNSYIVKPIDFQKFVDIASQIEVYWCAVNTVP
jgi:hypothetical protein